MSEKSLSETTRATRGYGDLKSTPIRDDEVVVTRNWMNGLADDIAALEAENSELKRLIKWIDDNRHADWPFATFNLEEWEKQRGP